MRLLSPVSAHSFLVAILCLSGCGVLNGALDKTSDDTGGDVDTDTDGGTDADGDGYPADTDCNDADATTFPGAPEVCDGEDNDCDSAIDESATDATTWYADTDGDGFGDETVTETACTASSGYVADATDCDDTTATQPDALGFCAAAYTTDFGSEMVVIEPGMYSMGSGPADVYGIYADHDVTLTHSFWMGKSEVTQAAWAAWTTASDTAPSFFAGDDLPVEQVSRTDAALYANALSAAEGLTPCYESNGSAMVAAYLADPYTCPGYRLPTEAEWEYAARAGEGYVYAGSDTASAVAWTTETSGDTTHNVCTLGENAWGLCDMSGNVFEWTNDWYDDYSSAAATDPAGPPSGSSRVLRGGCWRYAAVLAAVANRDGYPGNSSNFVGFRLSRSSLVP